MSELQRGLAEIERDLLEAHGRLVGRRRRRWRACWIVVAVVFALAAGTAAFPAGRAAAADSIERIASVLGLRAGSAPPASLPAWITGAPNLGAGRPLDGSARELGRDGRQRLLTYRDAQTGGLCVVFGSFREECDREGGDARWRQEFADTHVVLRGPWSSISVLRESEPARSQITASLFGLVDDRVATVEVTMADGTRVTAATPHGGFVVDRTPAPVAVEARDSSGVVIQQLDVVSVRSTCEPSCRPYVPTRLLGHVAALDVPASARDAPAGPALEAIDGLRAIPAPEVGDVLVGTARRIETDVPQGDMWLASTERGWVCVVFMGGECLETFDADAPFVRSSSWDEGEPTVHFGVVSDDVRRLRVTIGLDEYDVPIHENGWVFVVPGRPTPEPVGVTGWELTLDDGTIITTGPHQPS